MTFTHQKQYVTPEAKVITMKALITMHGIQSVDCYENETRYPAELLQEVKEPPTPKGE